MAADTTITPNDCVYELTTVLLHHGHSAHAGHYTAETWDSEKLQWWRIDDETVTPVPPVDKGQVERMRTALSKENEALPVAAPSLPQVPQPVQPEPVEANGHSIADSKKPDNEWSERPGAEEGKVLDAEDQSAGEQENGEGARKRQKIETHVVESSDITDGFGSASIDTGMEQQLEWEQCRRHGNLQFEGTRNAYMLIYRRVEGERAMKWRQWLLTLTATEGSESSLTSPPRAQTPVPTPVLPPPPSAELYQKAKQKLQPIVLNLTEAQQPPEEGATSAGSTPSAGASSPLRYWEAVVFQKDHRDAPPVKETAAAHYEACRERYGWSPPADALLSVLQRSSLLQEETQAYNVAVSKLK